jgi:hypothetical protein
VARETKLCNRVEDFGGLAWLLVSATSALAFAQLYLVRGRGGTNEGAPPPPPAAPAGDASRSPEHGA